MIDQSLDDSLSPIQCMARVKGGGMRNSKVHTWITLAFSFLSLLSGCASVPPEKLQIDPTAVRYTPTNKLTASIPVVWNLHVLSPAPAKMRSTVAIPAVGVAPAQNYSIDVSVPDAALYGPIDQQISFNLLRSTLAEVGIVERPRAFCQATLQFDSVALKTTGGYRYFVNATVLLRSHGRELWSKQYHLDSGRGKSRWKIALSSYQSGKHRLVKQLLEEASLDVMAWGKGQFCADESVSPAGLIDAQVFASGKAWRRK